MSWLAQNFRFLIRSTTQQIHKQTYTKTKPPPHIRKSTSYNDHDDDDAPPQTHTNIHFLKAIRHSPSSCFTK